MIQQPATSPPLTARDLRRMSPTKRQAALEAAAALAEREYRDDPDLTAFEAFGAADLHSPSAYGALR